jgi:hypothetical protein
MPTRVPKGKVLLSVAVDPGLREAAKAAAEIEEVTLTVFVARALRERLARRPTKGTKPTRTFGRVR